MKKYIIKELKQCRGDDIIKKIQITATLFYLYGGEIYLNNVSAIINCMTIKNRTDGRFEGRITIEGKRKSFYGNTKTEVKNKAKNYLIKVGNGFKEPKKILFNDYIDYWLKTYKWNKIEPSSYTRLYRVYECQIKNTIGNKMIGDITTKDIQKLIDDHANPPTRDIRPLAMSGLKRILQFLRPCMNRAVQEGIIYKNPCDNVILPKESCIQIETKKQYSLTDSEIEQIRNCALGKYKTTGEYYSRDFLVILLIINLGLRIGEALALEWSDVDFESKIVHINKTVQSNIKNFNSMQGNKATYNRIKKSTKTRSGVRTLQLNDDVIWYLNELKKYDERHNIISNYVCCTNVGTINISRNLQRSLNRLIGKTSITKKVTLHTLRHTFGSTLLRRGVSIEVISKLMGHANITITYNKYIHAIQEEEAKAMTTIKVC